MNEIYNIKNELNYWNFEISSGQNFVSNNNNFLIEYRSQIAIVVAVALAIFLTYHFVKLIYRSLHGSVNQAPNHSHPQTEIKPQDFIVNDVQKEQEFPLLSSKTTREYTIEEKNICRQLRILDDSIQCFEHLDFFNKWKIQIQDFDLLHKEIENYEWHGGENVTTFSHSALEIIYDENQRGERVLTFCRSAKKVLSDLQRKYKQLSKENMSLFPLPNDIQTHIFRYCSTKTIKRLSLVSKRINRLADSNLETILIEQCKINYSCQFPLKKPITARANVLHHQFRIKHIRKILRHFNYGSSSLIDEARINFREIVPNDKECINKQDLSEVICLWIEYGRHHKAHLYVGCTNKIPESI